MAAVAAVAAVTESAQQRGRESYGVRWGGSPHRTHMIMAAALGLVLLVACSTPDGRGLAALPELPADEARCSEPPASGAVQGPELADVDFTAGDGTVDGESLTARLCVGAAKHLPRGTDVVRVEVQTDGSLTTDLGEPMEREVVPRARRVFEVELAFSGREPGTATAVFRFSGGAADGASERVSLFVDVGPDGARVVGGVRP